MGCVRVGVYLDQEHFENCMDTKISGIGIAYWDVELDLPFFFLGVFALVFFTSRVQWVKSGLLRAEARVTLGIVLLLLEGLLLGHQGRTVVSYGSLLCKTLLELNKRK